jgi:integration host factor subunit alpha
MTLTKSNIIESIASANGISKDQSRNTFESLIEIIKQTPEDKEDVLISGFGKFYVRDKAPRKGRNPATGEDMLLWGRRVVTFRCSGKLRDKINGQ